jgi:protease-4
MHKEKFKVEKEMSTLGGRFMHSFFTAKARKDVKAIVLRIDSPEEVFLTSDLIGEWNSLKKIKAYSCFHGELCPSGGYYIACNANTILLKTTRIPVL